MTIAVIGADERYKFLSADLVARGYEVAYYSDWTTFLNSQDCESQVELAFLQIGAFQEVEKLVIPEHVTSVWCGSRQPVECGNCEVYRYTEDEDWLWMNADLTAESFLCWFYANFTSRITAYSWDVAGYGRVAKRLAKKLQALGADVSIRTRSHSQQAEARQDGFFAQPLTDSINPLSICVNTIPYPWLGAEQSHHELTVLDLASVPGGVVDTETVQYTQLLALPGKVYPQDAARDFLQILIRKGIVSESAKR